MSGKKLVTLCIGNYVGDNYNDDTTYVGRLLGLIDSEQAFAIVNEEKIKSKIRTSPTMNLLDVIERLDNSDLEKHNLRMVLELKEKNDEQVVTPKLLLTPIIRDLTRFKNAIANSVGLIWEEDTWVYVSEEEV